MKLGYMKLLWIWCLSVSIPIALNAQDDAALKLAERKFGSGNFYFSKGQFAPAVENFKASNAAVESSLTWYYLGLAYYRLNNYRECLTALSTALALKLPSPKFTDYATKVRKDANDMVRLGHLSYTVTGGALSTAPVIPTDSDNPYTLKMKMANKALFTQQRLFLPGGGVVNNGSTVGDFCCDGETATIVRQDNTPIGYMFFYAKQAPNSSVPTVRILLSGVRSLEDANSERSIDEIVFDVQKELHLYATKTRQVGSLTYKITILSVNKPTAITFTDLRIQVDVDVN